MICGVLCIHLPVPCGLGDDNAYYGNSEGLLLCFFTHHFVRSESFFHISPPFFFIIETIFENRSRVVSIRVLKIAGCCGCVAQWLCVQVPLRATGGGAPNEGQGCAL